jgi:hypothetical protein
MPDRWEPCPDMPFSKPCGLGRRWPRWEDSALKNQIGKLNSEVNAHGCEMNVYMIYA